MNLEGLPRGLIVGTVELTDSFPAKPKHANAACLHYQYMQGCYGWQLANPDHFVDPFPPKYLPYGTWFYPFHRKNSD